MKQLLKVLVSCHLLGLSGLVVGANAPSTLTIDASQDGTDVSETIKMGIPDIFISLIFPNFLKNT